MHTPSDRPRRRAGQGRRALAELRIEGVATNTGFLQALLRHPTVVAGEATTRFVDDHVAELVAGGRRTERLCFTPAAATATAAAGWPAPRSTPSIRWPCSTSGEPEAAGAPGTAAPPPVVDELDGPAGTTAVRSPLQGTVVALDVAEGDPVAAGQQLLVMESMKMEHVVAATEAGFVRLRRRRPSATPSSRATRWCSSRRPTSATSWPRVSEEVDLDAVRPDLALINERHAITLDAARPDAVARRRKTGQRTARENIDDLCDPGTFVEHGSLVLTPGTGLPMDEVIRKFPTDGMVCGVGSVNGEQFGPDGSRTVVCAYDYTVLAGTQGAINHPKTDRMLELAKAWRLPLVFFTEGGGGRAGTGGNRTGEKGRDPSSGNFLGPPAGHPDVRIDGPAQRRRADDRHQLRALLRRQRRPARRCDVIIATDDSNIGMGGPAMIEGGGLGVFSPDEVGPIDVQVRSGVVDIARRATRPRRSPPPSSTSRTSRARCRRGSAPTSACCARSSPRTACGSTTSATSSSGLADTGSVLELRRGFGLGMVTALFRIEGRPVGVIANNPNHLAGAIDSDGSDKAARFMQLCDAFDIPLLVLCDTPGIMVGPGGREDRPRAPLQPAVRHRRQPVGAAVHGRPAQGLRPRRAGDGRRQRQGAVLLRGLADRRVRRHGPGGPVKLGFRNELQNITDPVERKARFDHLVAEAYERSKAIHQGVAFGVDDVIDPATPATGWPTACARSPVGCARRTASHRRLVRTVISA